MIRHFVMWKLKDEANGKTKEENQRIIKSDLEGLVGKCKAIKHDFIVGINITDAPHAYDLILDSTFDSYEDLLEYKKDPQHKAASVYNKSCSIDKIVVDYEV